MKHYETVQVSQQLCVDVTCDICGKHQEQWERVAYPEQTDFQGTYLAGRGDDCFEDPNRCSFWEDELSITHRFGVNYPECGHGMELIPPDICPRCWKEKILPALRAAGLKLQYRFWDW